MAEPTIPSEAPDWDTDQTNWAPPDGGHVSDGYQTNEFPASNVVNWLFNVWGRWINWLKAYVLIQPGANANSNLAISSNTITPTKGNHTITAAGTINTIAQTNMNDGRILVICGTNSQTVTLTNLAGGTGQIQSADGNNIVLASSKDNVTLQRQGTKWVELNRTISIAVTNRQLLTSYVSATGSLTVPANTTQAKIRVWGAGGGGGGGGGGLTGPGEGVAGGAGGDTWVGASGNAARGGLGGAGGGASQTSGVGGAGGAARAIATSSTKMQAGALAGSTGNTRNNGTGGAGGASSQLPFMWTAGARGGGGGGIPGPGGTNGGGGGGGGSIGEYAEYTISVTPGASLTVTIGAGGSSGAGGAAGGGGSPGVAGAAGDSGIANTGGAGAGGGGGGDGTGTAAGGAGGSGGSGFAVVEWLG